MWQERYAGWPVLKKLQYVDQLMRELAKRDPLAAPQRHVEPVSRLTKTLREHYQKKRRHYGLEHPDFYDRDLRRLFSAAQEFKGNMTAASFLGRIRKEVRRKVARWTG